ncbi:MAG TPA: GDSL-type esterase/lipase family protein [Burkholderiales bacterium]|nr:GDSL-type esterase/lipase family protein [Burkholderiales bacterium]
MLRLAAINVGLLAALAVVVLLIAEGWLRLTVPASTGGTIYEYTTATPRYKVMKANASIVAWGEELRTNELGFRDAPVGPKKPGELRVAVLGDSLTVSAGVPADAIWTSRLQERLRATHPQARVVNLAVGGYNLEQYAIVLEEVGLRLQPDVILIGIAADNDFADDTFDANRRVAQGLQPPPADPAFPKSLYVYRAYLGKVFDRFFRAVEPRPAMAATSKEAVVQRNRDALRHIVEAARARGVPVAAVVLPQNWHFARQRPDFDKVLAECRAQAMPCLDMLERFTARKLDPSELRLNALDSHPNKQYNALVAEALEPFVQQLIRAPSPNLLTSR